MIDILIASPLFGVFFSVLCWQFGHLVQKKSGFFLFNHMLIATATGVIILLVLDIPYEAYYSSAAFISGLLAPATAVLALNIYRQRTILKKHLLPVLVGCTVGCITSLGSILLLCHLLSVNSVLTNSILPKSVTTAIAMSIAESRGGVAGIAAAAVMVPGILGPIFAVPFAKLFRITNPVAEGLAIGASSHALGTARAIEIGELQGALSSIALCLCGIITSVLVLFI